jgi:predicted methyltransferase MtxX (methanogen marker protein 4)
LELHQPNRSLFGITGLLSHAAEKELDPGCKAALLAGGEEMVVILRPVLLEIGGQVEQRLRQRSSQHQHHRNEQTSNPTVPVEKWVDHLELIVSDS